MNRVRTNSWYFFHPVALDVYDAKTSLSPGERVQVRNVRGCPPANTMGHAHVYDTAGQFRGLVCTASLRKVSL